MKDNNQIEDEKIEEEISVEEDKYGGVIRSEAYGLCLLCFSIGRFNFSLEATGKKGNVDQ
jgi:hypothetical protein